MATNYDMIGREEINDLEAILSITNSDVDEVRAHRAAPRPTTLFTWDYERSRPALGEALREGQDVAVERRDRPRLVDRGRPGRGRAGQPGRRIAQRRSARPSTSRARRSSPGPRTSGSSSASSRRTGRSRQFMHGEQGALICTAQIVETVPWIDAKYYAATQVMDEARHVEVFAKYLDDEAVGALPDQRAPEDAPRRHHLATAAGT